MTLFSAKGQKSTVFERLIFGAVLLTIAALIAPGIHETMQINRVFANAEPAVLARCQGVSDYAAWRFWNSKVQAYAACIVEAKDPAVQNAAGKYLLRGKQGEFTVQPGSTAPGSAAP